MLPSRKPSPRRATLPALGLGLLLALLHLACPITGLDLKLGSMAQKQQHYEIIHTLQPMVDRGEAVPSRQLLFLAGAYAETRNYAHLFPACDRFEAQIQAGDRWMGRADLAAMPHFLRANAWLDLGDPARALAEARASERLVEAYPGNQFYRDFALETWGAMGVAQALLHHPDGAEHCLRRLESVDIGITTLGPAKFAAIAKVRMALGQYDRALAALQDPKAEYHGIASLFIDKTYQKLPAAFLMAKCQFETGRLDQARDTYDRLLQHPRLPEVGGLYWQALLDRARIARKDRQDPLAEDLLRKAVDVVERQRASIGTEAGRIGFVGDKQACYQELVALLADQGRAADAFAFVERAKGRALVDLLASQKQLARGGGEAQALARLDQADQDLQALHDPAAPGARGIAVSARVQLAGVAPELASLVSVPQVDPGALQARLGADETLLEYFAAGSRWLAFVVTRDRVTATPLPVQDLTAQVLALRLALADPSRPVPDQAAALYRQLVEPVADQLRTPRLTLVPHGVLHYLPFCALGPADAPMVERFSLRVLPSATVLAFLKPGRPAGGSLILGNPDLGDPALDLPFAQEEAAALAGILPSPTLLVRKEATPDPVRAAGGRYSVIHLAAHGFFDVDHPLESALFLAPTAQGRGTLKVADLYHMDLDTDLVTLSACETALGKVSSGDDVVGFTRGLLYAGSRSVLSSLWKVDDRSTRDLMVGFYSRLGSADKAEALRQAQLEVRARMPHPYYWAAFTLTGNAR